MLKIVNLRFFTTSIVGNRSNPNLAKFHSRNNRTTHKLTTTNRFSKGNFVANKRYFSDVKNDNEDKIEEKKNPASNQIPEHLKTDDTIKTKGELPIQPELLGLLDPKYLENLKQSYTSLEMIKKNILMLDNLADSSKDKVLDKLALMYRRNLDNQILLLIQPPSFFPKEPLPNLSMWIELLPEQRLLSSFFLPKFDSKDFIEGAKMALYTSLENLYIKKDIKQFAGLVTPEFYKYTLEPFESYMSSTGIKVVDIDVDVKSADIKKINWGSSIDDLIDAQEQLLDGKDEKSKLLTNEHKSVSILVVYNVIETLTIELDGRRVQLRTVPGHYYFTFKGKLTVKGMEMLTDSSVDVNPRWMLDSWRAEFIN